jgi:hypothetical protein
MTHSSLIGDAFGELTWYPDHNCWGGYLTLQQSEIPVTVIPGSADADSAARYTNALIEKLKQQESAFRDEVAASLLETYNTEWHPLTGEGPELSAAEFKSRLKLTMLQISFGTLNLSTPEAWYGQLQYDADDMFTEHLVSLFIDHSLKFVTAVI